MNRPGAERPLKAVGWSLLFLFGGYALGILFLILSVSTLPTVPGSLGEAAVETAAMLFGYGVLTWLIGFRALKLRAADFGVGSPGPVTHRFKGFGWGLVVGVALSAAAMLLSVPLGHAAWRSDGGTFPQWLQTVLLTGAVILPAAFAEELAFRGVPLITLSRSFGRAPVIVVLALLFALFHLDNDQVTLLALANIALAGILLGIAFFTPGGMITSTGVHFGWNLTLAALAAPVSGTPIPMPWVDYSPGGPLWLTGGGFGPEGGVVATVCLLAGTLLAMRRTALPQKD